MKQAIMTAAAIFDRFGIRSRVNERFLRTLTRKTQLPS